MVDTGDALPGGVIAPYKWCKNAASCSGPSSFTAGHHHTERTCLSGTGSWHIFSPLECHQFASCVQELRWQSLLCLYCDCGKQHCKVGSCGLQKRGREWKRNLFQRIRALLYKNGPTLTKIYKVTKSNLFVGSSITKHFSSTSYT